MTIPMTALEQYFSVVLFTCMPFKAVVTSESMSGLLECDHSDER